MRTADWHAPTGLNECGDTVPGALPQAGIGRAVGPSDEADNADTFQYIEISGLRSDGTATSEPTPTDEAPSRASQKVHQGDIITSTVRPIRRLSAIIGPDQHEHVCSSGFVVLEPKAIAPEVLLTYLRLPIVCELMDLHTSASLYPAISERDLLKLPIPKIPEKAAQTIITQIRQAHHSRQEAQALLAKAKRAVEVAIEEGEEKAIASLKW
jgi:restriction endonuclease S subunit